MRSALFPSMLAVVIGAFVLPLRASAPPARDKAAALQTPTYSFDLCDFEDDHGSAGSAPVCDPFVACDIDRYSCTLNARTGLFEPIHRTFCGTCQPLFRSDVAPGREVVPVATTPLPSAAPDGGLERVSVGPGGTEAIGGGSLSPKLSADGRFVVFDSAATNLVSGDTNGRRDVFLVDRTSGHTERVSVASDESEANHHSIAGVVSDDGNVVVFLSAANNLVPNDTNGRGDVFVRDRLTGTTQRVNLGPGGVQAIGASAWYGGSVGSWPEYGLSVFSYEGMIAGNTEIAISADGRYVAFVSDATNLGAGDTNDLPDVFVHDRQTGITSRVSLTEGGMQLTHAAGTHGLSRPHVAMSANGRFVAFTTNYAGVAGDTNNVSDVYVRDLQMNQTARVSIGTGGTQSNGFSGWPSLSADGRFVAFASDASNLVPGADDQRDVYLHDRQTGATTRVSMNTVPGFLDRALLPAISRDGRWVVYMRGSAAYAVDTQTGILRPVSRANAGSHANAVVLAPAINGDGSVLAFASPATNLTPGDTNAADDVFIAPGNFVYNGGFGGGATYWQVFDANGGIVWTVTNGAMHFYRTGPHHALVFQSTDAAVPIGVPLEAEFTIANTSSVRKRISVLIHDNTFSDLSVCTFWLEANAPTRTYRMRTHTTRPWTNATLSFYAASVGSNGGNYVLDNVSFRAVPGASTARTDCFDPMVPAPSGGPPGANLLVNGDFSGGLPPWILFGQIVAQVAGSVLEFYRPSVNPAGVVLQPTGVPVATNQILTATLRLGNSSAVRKRVTVLLHDLDFSDLSACTFWLEPGQPLASYAMRAYATAAWTDATLSVYASTVDTQQWTRVDDVTMQLTPGATIQGTECVEPGGEPPPAVAHLPLLAARPAVRRTGRIDQRSADHAPRRQSSGSTAASVAIVDLANLQFATSERRRLIWHVAPRTSPALFQLSDDNAHWTTIALVAASEEWLEIAIDVSPSAADVLFVRVLPLVLGPKD